MGSKVLFTAVSLGGYSSVLSSGSCEIDLFDARANIEQTLWSVVFRRSDFSTHLPARASPAWSGSGDRREWRLAWGRGGDDQPSAIGGR